MGGSPHAGLGKKSGLAPAAALILSSRAEPGPIPYDATVTLSAFLNDSSQNTFVMSNTELVPVALPQSAILTSTVVDDHERTSQRPQDEERDPWNGRRREQELAPVDGGPAAWRLLCAAFMFEALLWGTVMSVIEIDRD